MLSYVKLPFHFDPDRLKADLDKILLDEWIPHFNTHDYEGQWSGVAFRAIGGDEHNIIPMMMTPMLFGDTPLLARCGYIREVLHTLECPQKSVRFLKLHAGSSIREHIDRELDYENGEVRLHIPVLTNRAIEFYLDGERLLMQEGECWYTNVNLPHRVDNQSTVDRVHLVIDCVVNDWLHTVFETAAIDVTNATHQNRYQSMVLLPETLQLATILQLLSEYTADCKNVDSTMKFIAQGSRFVLSWKSQPTQWSITIDYESTLDVGDEAVKAILQHAERSESSADYKRRLMITTSPDPNGKHANDYQSLLHKFKQDTSTVLIFDQRTQRLL